MKQQGPRDIERGSPDDADRLNTNNAPESEAEDTREAVKGALLQDAPQQDDQARVRPAKNPGGSHAA